MSILKNMVDKTSVNYEQVFIYSFGVSLSDITDEINKATVSVFVPDFLEYYIPSCDCNGINHTEVAVEGGTNIIYEYSGVDFSGIMNTLKLECRFKYPATITSFDCTATLFLNDSVTPFNSSTAPTVNLVLVANFILVKNVYIPITNPVAGGFVIWKTVLRNIGDKGASITNFTMTDILPGLPDRSIVKLPELWSIEGNDTSNNRFADTKFDGVVASNIAEDLESFTFDLNGTYTGTEYTIISIGLIEPDAPINQYADTISWSAEGKEVLDASTSLEIINPTPQVEFTSDPPTFVKRGNFFSSITSIENTGNVNMDNVVFTVDVPPQIQSYRFQTGVFGIPEVRFIPNIDYTIDLVFTDANDNSQSQTLTGFNTGVNSSIRAEDIVVPPGYSLSRVIARIPNLVPGTKSIEQPSTYAFVESVDTTGTTSIQNFSSLAWENAGTPYVETESHTTNINNNVSLVVIKQQANDDLISEDTELNGIIRFRATIECDQSYVYMPILVEALPPSMSYLGNETYTYYDYQNNLFYDSTDVGVAFPLPILRPSEVTLADGIRVVRFSYTGDNSFNLKQRDILTIEFDVKITSIDYASNKISNLMYLGNYGNDGSVGQNAINFLDTTLDYDGDGFISESLAQSLAVNLNVIYSARLDSITKTKGSQNLDYVDGVIPVRSIGGKDVNFKLILTNSGTKPIFNLEIINIVPHVNDTSIINPEIPRLSGFTTGYVDSSIELSNPNSDIIFEDFFSDSYNPVRFNTINEEIGDGVWTEEKIENTVAVKYTMVDGSLKPNETIELILTVSTPSEKDEELVAYNTFAVRGSYNDENDRIEELFPVEPFRKGVRGIGEKTINGIVFLDTDKNGIYSFGKPGMNGIVVTLYDDDGNEISQTRTDSFDGLNGYYFFPDIPEGNYYIIFNINDVKYKFTKQVLDNAFGSKPDSLGITPLIVINDQTIEINAYAGLLDVAIDNLLAVNKSANKNMRGAVYSNIALDIKLNDVIDYGDLYK